ncbi:tRNA (adenosine(37)-N6)-threonylcarbamoyltransferase complex dimerization subunit type 1 TsaB [Roseibium sp.]|uniref:tRNA (adenosine(37)-N6)-threonylcarbamoyltransferase complex dimerization subunit type 1 TsaB n=1 Tax=Roseibium sp. TaxID=1936156 RepID=UPI003A97CD1A
MRVLAIDTALANCAAAVLDNSSDMPCYVETSEEVGRGHAEKLMAMIGEVMAESSTAFTDLDRVVVTTGPGSFTGLRVGLSVAKGFGLVLEKPVVGITTLAAIARAMAARGLDGPVLVALTGKADEVYCQLFDDAGEPLEDAAVRKLGTLSGHIPAGTCLAGSAASKVAEALEGRTAEVLCEAGFPAIADVAHLGLTADPKSAIAAPLYLRPPDATPQKKGRIERK